MATDPLAPLLDLPGVSGAVDAARESVDRLLSHRVLRHASARVSAESAMRGARASAELEGRGVSLADVRAGRVEDPVLNGALRVTGEVGSLVETWQLAPRQALARMHLLAARDLVGDPLELGRPIAAGPVSARLDQLAEVLVGPDGRRSTKVPAVVVGAVVHGEIMALQPFPQGTGLVARAAERLTLVARGLDPKSLVIPELGHLEAGGAQTYRLRARGFAEGSPEGVAAWLLHCCEAVSLGAREATAVCESIQRG
jgi:hypothetical protein